MWGRRVLVLRQSERRNRHHECQQNMPPQGTFIHREFHRELLNLRNFRAPAKTPTCGQYIDETLSITFLEPGGKKAGKSSVRASDESPRLASCGGATLSKILLEAQSFSEFP
jgi:hypothetical protein